MPYKTKFPDISKKLYWRVSYEFTKIVPYRIRSILDLISEDRRLFSICETELLYIIATAIDRYASSIRTRKDLETIKEMIENIEKHGSVSV